MFDRSSRKKPNALGYTNIMMDMACEYVINHPELTPNQAWNHIKETLDKKSNNSWIGKNDTEVRNRVKYIRHVMLGKDVFRMIEQPHVGKMKDSNFWFLQFNMSTVNPDTNALERMTGFGNPELFYLLKGKTHLHIDGTFFTVPHPFSQLIVVMVCDEQVELRAPVLHVLVTGKSCARHATFILTTNELNTNATGK